MQVNKHVFFFHIKYPLLEFLFLIRVCVLLNMVCYFLLKNLQVIYLPDLCDDKNCFAVYTVDAAFAEMLTLEF